MISGSKDKSHKYYFQNVISEYLKQLPEASKVLSPNQLNYLNYRYSFQCTKGWMQQGT